MTDYKNCRSLGLWVISDLAERGKFGMIAVCAGLMVSPVAAQAQRTVIPVGEPMAANPVPPASKLIEKKATFDGVERSWYEYIPASYTGNIAVPLVVAVHGGTSNGVSMFKTTSWAQIADQTGIIVLYPNGSIGENDKLRWNGYPEFNSDPRMALSANNGVDEAKFFKDMIEKTEKDYKIDSARIYMHGQSNGGMMTSYFGLRYPEMLAAMGVSSAPPSIEIMSKYAVTTQLPTYFWSGELDTLNGQYNPGNKSRTVICKEFAEFWARINKTDPEPKLRLDASYNTLIYEGAAEVRSTEFRNGVHEMPFMAAYVIWNEFFTRFSRGANGEIKRIVPDTDQAGPADKGAVAVKLGTPFALADNKVIRIGKTPDQEPVLAPGAPRAGVLIPAEILATAFGAKTDYSGDSVRITTKTGAVTFVLGAAKITFNGKDITIGVPSRRVDDEMMVSLDLSNSTVLGKTIDTRKDAYRNDIYYIGDRPADLSAQTITYIDQKLGGRN